MTTLRDIIHINTSTLSPAAVSLDNYAGRIDGSNTLLTCGGTCNVISMGAGQMILSGLRIGGGTGTVIPVSVSGGHLTIYNSELLGVVTTTGGSIDIHAATLDDGSSWTNGGHLSIDRSVLLQGNYFVTSASSI